MTAVTRLLRAGLTLSSVVAPRLTILTFHRVLPEPDPMFPAGMTRQKFSRLLDWIQGSFQVVSLPEGARGLQQGSLPSRALAITFDDGYANNYTVAAPMLRDRGLPATFFVTTAFRDGGCMWNDRIIESMRLHDAARIDLSAASLGTLPLTDVTERKRAAWQLINAIKYLPWQDREAAINATFGPDLPACEALMMTDAQIRALAAIPGMTIGGHTHSHPILARLAPEVARKEITANRELLESITGEPITWFAYPNGQPGTDYDASHVRMLKESGFEGAVTTAQGAAGPGDSLFQLPRFTSWDKTPDRFLARVLLSRLQSARPSALDEHALTPGPAADLASAPDSRQS